MSWPTGTDTRVSSEHKAITEHEVDEDAATILSTGKQLEDELATIGAEPMLAKPAAPPPGPTANRAPSLELDIVVEDAVTRAPIATAAAPAATPPRRTKLFVGVALGAVAAAAAVLFAVSGGKSRGNDPAKPLPAKQTAPAARASDQPVTPPNLAKDVMSGEVAPAATADHPAADASEPPPGVDHAAAGAGEPGHDVGATDTEADGASTATAGETPDPTTDEPDAAPAKAATSTKGATVKGRPKKPVTPTKPSKPAGQDKGSWNPDQLFPE
jgi:hypothetical protein